MSNSLNKQAANLLLSGENDADKIREAINTKVGGRLRKTVGDVLRDKTSLEGEKIVEICDEVIERYLDQ